MDEDYIESQNVLWDMAEPNGCGKSIGRMENPKVCGTIMDRNVFICLQCAESHKYSNNFNPVVWKFLWTSWINK
jgi:hypothetical protein